MRQKKTSGTPLGGLPKAFKFWISFTFRSFTFSCACSTRGINLATSASQVSCSSVASFLIILQDKASSEAMSDWICTFAFSIPTIVATLSASTFLASTSTVVTFRTSSSPPTTDSVSSSLTRPVSYISLAVVSLVLLASSILLKSLISSKKVLGVV